MKSTSRRPIAALFSASIMAFVLFGSTSAYAQSRTSKNVRVTRTSNQAKTPARSTVTRTTTVTRKSPAKTAPARKKVVSRKATVVKKAPAKRAPVRKVVKRAPRYERVVIRGKVYYRHDGRYFHRVTRRGRVEYVAPARQPNRRG